jgi:hypothetical protein
MIKIVVLAALVLAAYRLVTNRWPWEPRRLGGRSLAKTQARVLLGVSEAASREDIIDAHRRLVTQIHPDKGGTSELMHEANSARDLLLTELQVR